MCLENARKMGLIRKTQSIGHICDAFTLPYPLSRKVDTLVQLPGMGRHTRGGPESPAQLIAAHTGQLRQIAQGGAAGWPVLQEIPPRLDLFAQQRGDGRSIEAQPSRLSASAKELDQRIFFFAWIVRGEKQIG